MQINGQQLGPNGAVYIVAELSANHGQSLDRALRLIHAAKDAGADAVKVQTYTPDTITFNSDKEYFRINTGTLWDGTTLYDLYSRAYTPWEWHWRLKAEAEAIGLHFFSSPFDFTAVDFLEELNVPAYKIASAELVDIPLIRYIAQTKKPLIISTGMAQLSEIEEAVCAARAAGADEIALLRTNSGYPAIPEEVNLQGIPYLAETFGVTVGLSDHTLELAIPVAAVALGATIIEKHLTLSRDVPTPDSAFSLDPLEFKQMVDAIRITEKALGKPKFGPTEREEKNLAFRRSLFVTKNIAKGETFNRDNIRSIRPGYGLHPRYLDKIIGKKATRNLSRGTPLQWEYIEPQNES